MRSDETLPVLDWQELLQRLGDDQEFIAEVLAMTVEEAAREVPEIEAALAAGEMAHVQELAHALKGATANTSARALCAVAADVELACRDGRSDSVPELVKRLQPEYERFRHAVLVANSGGEVA